MCFSASASFVAGAGLSVAGIATIAFTRRRATLPFAAIPLLFGIQQLIEGLIWLSFKEGSRLPNGPLALAFSLFSHVLWPIFMPFAVRRLETDPGRKKVQAAAQIAGVAVGLYLLYFLLREPVVARVLGMHIQYDSPHFNAPAVMLLYLFSSCGAFVAASDRMLQAFGASLLTAFLVAYVVHTETLFSMWCFFAAVLSLIVAAYLGRERGLRARGSHRVGGFSPGSS